MKHRLQALVFASIVFAIALDANDASACVTCATGDPSLAAMGNEAWSRDAWRVQSSVRLRSFRVADAQIDERRLGLALQYAPIDRLSLMVRQFVAHQTLTLENLSRERRYVFSDPWLGARLMLVRDHRYAPRHLLTLDVGTTLPVVEAKESQIGPPGRDAQLTGDRAEVNAGLAYRFQRSATAVLARASIRSGDDPAFLGQVRLAYQPAPAVSFVVGGSVQRVLRAPADTIVSVGLGFRVRAGVNTFGVELALPLHVDVADGDAGPILLLDWVIDA